MRIKGLDQLRAKIEDTADDGKKRFVAIVVELPNGKTAELLVEINKVDES